MWPCMQLLAAMPFEDHTARSVCGIDTTKDDEGAARLTVYRHLVAARFLLNIDVDRAWQSWRRSTLPRGSL